MACPVLHESLPIATENRNGGPAIDDAPSEEPKLDPRGARETRVKTTDTAVDALKQTRNEMDTSDAGGETREIREE